MYVRMYVNSGYLDRSDDMSLRSVAQNFIPTKLKRLQTEKH